MGTPTTNLPTRQQLDEIDALLRRMLSLPSVAGEPAEPPQSPQQPAPAPMTFPPPTVREIPPASPPAPGDPRVQSWRVEWPQYPAPAPPQLPATPPVVAWGAPVTPPVEPPPWAALASNSAAAVQAPYAVPMPPGGAQWQPSNPVIVPQTATATRQSESLVILALVVLNGTFNLLTYLLGPIGGWLRGPGRNAMGWVGVLMIVAASIWALGNWYGYDWPKPNWHRLGMSH